MSAHAKHDFQTNGHDGPQVVESGQLESVATLHPPHTPEAYDSSSVRETVPPYGPSPPVTYNSHIKAEPGMRDSQMVTTVAERWPSAEKTTPKDGERRILGLRVVTFWLVVALVLALITAAAVGGGLGTKLGTKKQSSSPLASNANDSATVTATATATATETNTASASASTASGTALPTALTKGYNDCPNSDQTSFTAATSAVFTKTCGVDWPAGGPAADGSGNVKDLLAIVAYSLDDCISACAVMNKKQKSDVCKGVTWSQNIAKNRDTNLGNCWLKDRVGKDKGGYSAAGGSAKLVQDLFFEEYLDKQASWPEVFSIKLVPVDVPKP